MMAAIWQTVKANDHSLMPSRGGRGGRDMPRITEERREARRADIVDAARRCFSRDGFHQTSMPDIAAEAGLSAGAFYRYFSSKDEIIVEIAAQAFGMMFGAVDQAGPPSAGDLVAGAIEPFTRETERDTTGREVPVGELLRCVIQVWAELLRNDGLRERAASGFEEARARTAAALRRGQELGMVNAGLDPEHGARVVMALLHGFLLQRIALGLDDVEAFVQAARALFTSPRR
jgi:AcrR family transcriptional regulator